MFVSLHTHLVLVPEAPHLNLFPLAGLHRSPTATSTVQLCITSFWASQLHWCHPERSYSQSAMFLAIQSPFLQVSESGSQLVFVSRTRLLMMCSPRAQVSIAKPSTRRLFILQSQSQFSCLLCLRERTYSYMFSYTGSRTSFNEWLTFQEKALQLLIILCHATYNKLSCYICLCLASYTYVMVHILHV